MQTFGESEVQTHTGSAAVQNAQLSIGDTHELNVPFTLDDRGTGHAARYGSAVFDDEVAPKAEKFRKQHHLDREVWEKAGELGLLCMSIPEEYGGMGASFAHEVIMMEEQARICDTTFGFIPGALNSPGFFHGTATPEQLRKWMPEIAAGKKMIAVAITEPDAGTDVKALRTSARREGNEYVLNGNKIFARWVIRPIWCLWRRARVRPALVPKAFRFSWSKKPNARASKSTN